MCLYAGVSVCGCFFRTCGRALEARGCCALVFLCVCVLCALCVRVLQPTSFPGLLDVLGVKGGSEGIACAWSLPGRLQTSVYAHQLGSAAVGMARAVLPTTLVHDEEAHG